MELLPPDLVSITTEGRPPHDHWFVEMYGSRYELAWPEYEQLVTLAKAEDPAFWDEARRLWREKSDDLARFAAAMYHF